MFCCPVCGQQLNHQERVFRCPAGHSFDEARQGYVNLLLGRDGGRHGDDKQMISARTAFLNRGWYLPLADTVAAACLMKQEPVMNLLDCGCGECYYTEKALQTLWQEGRQVCCAGMDISRDALLAAARRTKEISLAVASVSAIPMEKESVDVILNLFAPECFPEFFRVLKPGGLVIKVIPLENHLLALKKAIYDQPYPNQVIIPAPKGFRLLQKTELKNDIMLTEKEDVQNLFRMTPYYYKTGRADQEKADQICTMAVETEFAVLLYGKDDEP